LCSYTGGTLGSYTGELGEYFGDVGEYAGDVGEVGAYGLYDGLIGGETDFRFFVGMVALKVIGGLLKFIVGGLKFIVGGLKFIVGGLKFIVGGLKFICVFMDGIVEPLL